MHDRLSELSARELLQRLSTSAPIPGGGSAAALAGAMGAALVHMVVELTSGRPSASEHEGTLASLRADAARLRDELIDLAELDAAAYDRVVVARRLPRDTEVERAERQASVAAATHDATMAPLQAARAAADVLALAEELAPIGNRNAITDAAVGGMLAATAVRGAALNVVVNLPYLATDDSLGATAGAEIEQLLGGLDDRELALRRVVDGRMG
jgi:formiminotetrahydrofolate cyclodeaminase